MADAKTPVPIAIGVAAVFGPVLLVGAPLPGEAQASRRHQAPGPQALTPEQKRADEKAAAIADELEAMADVMEAAQRACGGPWRFRDPSGDNSYWLDIVKLRFTLRRDSGEIVRGLADPVGTATVQLIGDDDPEDASDAPLTLECQGGSALMRDEQSGREVMLHRP